EAGGDEFLEGAFVPCVRAVFVEHRRGAIDDRCRQDGFAAFRAVERGNRHAPGSLARDAPVRSVQHHVLDALASPGGYPTYFVTDLIKRCFTKRPLRPALARDNRLAIHPYEPLRRREKDHRVMAAPAVRVL